MVLSTNIGAPPDGGFDAWLCCACIVCMNFATWGVNISFSIFLNYYLTNEIFPNTQPTSFGMIGGLVVALTALIMPVVTILYQKFGYRITVIIGICCQIGAFTGTAFSRNIHELYFTQGALLGTAIGIIFGANLMVLPTWFLKKRAMVNGLSHFGNGVGSIVYSFIINKMLSEYNTHKYAILAVGGMSVFIWMPLLCFLLRLEFQRTLLLTKTTRPLRLSWSIFSD